MASSSALSELAGLMGVATRFRDGLGEEITVSSETLVRICAAMGAPIETPADAPAAILAHRGELDGELISPVVVAWDGVLADVEVNGTVIGPIDARLVLEDGTEVAARSRGGSVHVADPLPAGYHRLRIEHGGEIASAVVIAAPRHSWHPDDPTGQRLRSWGLSTQLNSLRSVRSRSVGDLTDLATVARWVGSLGGDLVSVLPLLPTFNDLPAEPSPYSPVSRLHWSELVLDLGAAHVPTVGGALLDVGSADAEVRAALQGAGAPDPAAVSSELADYAAFRGAQAKLGRDWRCWPARPRAGSLEPGDIDEVEEQFHLVSQVEAGRQLAELRRDLDAAGVGLGLDLAVGVHPEGYDGWARPELFAHGVSVGAPPDPGFPSGQNWGFPPVLPARSRLDGHGYIAASVAHQAKVADVLRIDHIMAMDRLYWIPEGASLADGTYVNYPVEELFAVLCLESHRNRCELVGENLGTVPPSIDDALPEHHIWGTYLAEFEAATTSVAPPTASEVSMIGTHDTPTLAGWIEGIDIGERVRLGLLDEFDEPGERLGRRASVRRLARSLGAGSDDPEVLLDAVLHFLGTSDSPLVVVWLEDLWLETEPVNVPGSSSAERPNWRRPLRRTLDDALGDAEVVARLTRLAAARRPG